MSKESNAAYARTCKGGFLPLAAAAFAVGLLGHATIADAAAQSATPSQELRTEVDRYVASWNTHDANVLGAHFTADADMIMGTGPILRGREAIKGQWKKYFAVQEPERALTIEVLSSRSITADVAVLNVRTTTGGRTREGTELARRRARGTWVLVRQDDEWRIASMRGMPTQQDRIIRTGGR